MDAVNVGHAHAIMAGRVKSANVLQKAAEDQME